MDEVQSVHLLGNAQALPFQLTAEGLIVTLLTQKPCDHAYVLKITGLDLKASRSAPPPLPVIRAATVSTMTLLPNSAPLSAAKRRRNHSAADSALPTATLSPQKPRQPTPMRLLFSIPAQR